MAKIPAQTLIEIGFTPEEAKAMQIFEPKGCDKCNNTGYKGRVGLFEVMELDEEIREMIMIGASTSELRQKAKEKGMLTLRMSGLEKSSMGITSIEEVLAGNHARCKERDMALPLPQLLKIMVDEGGTDLHITTNSPPLIRVHGLLKRIEHPSLSPAETKQMIYSILNDNQKYKFEENWELDFSFGIKGLARFRANVFMQRGAVAGAFRRIPYEIWSFEKLGLPAIVPTMTNKARGLILVTGPTGSGKTTTLASMIDKINKENPVHIITIEDPIEYLHSHRKAMVNQRELHADTKSFPMALRSVLREDPDVVLIGEMRDLETIQAAITIAETGHLTFATLHTNSAAQTINRIIDVFPAAPAGPGPHPAVHEPGGHHHPGAAAQGRRPRPLPGHGGADPDAGHPPPDPRQQDPPDLFVHADGPGKIRHDHLQPVPGQPVFQARHLAGAGHERLAQSRRTAGADQPRPDRAVQPVQDRPCPAANCQRRQSRIN